MSSGMQKLMARLKEWPLLGVMIIGGILSWIAIFPQVTPNQDSMYYIEAAKAYGVGGFEAASRVYNWPILSVVVYYFSKAIGAEIPIAAYLLSSVFMLSIAAIWVKIVQLKMPEAVWVAVVVMVSLPAFNVFRDDILRDQASWFFISLSILYLFIWENRPTWIGAGLLQLLVCVAALFRPESLVFLVAPILWQFWKTGQTHGMRDVLKLATVPLLGLFVSIALFAKGGWRLPDKVSHQLMMVSPDRLFADFSARAQTMTGTAVHRLSADDVGFVLFFGLLGVLLLKFIANFGVLIVPFFLTRFRDAYGTYLDRFSPLVFYFGVYALVAVFYLMAFGLIISRYLVSLNFFVVPLLVIALFRFLDKSPRYGLLVIAVLALVALDNVISISPPKLHVQAAAEWLKKHPIEESSIYFDDHEVAYLAGMNPVRALVGQEPNREILSAAVKNKVYKYYFLRHGYGDQDVNAWALQNGLSLVVQFDYGQKRKILVYMLDP